MLDADFVFASGSNTASFADAVVAGLQQSNVSFEASQLNITAEAGSILVTVAGPAEIIRQLRQYIAEGLLVVMVNGEPVQAKLVVPENAASLKPDKRALPMAIALVVLGAAAIVALVCSLCHRKRTVTLKGTKYRSTETTLATDDFFIDDDQLMEAPKKPHYPGEAKEKPAGKAESLPTLLLKQRHGVDPDMPHLGSHGDFEFFGDADVIAHPENYDFYVIPPSSALSGGSSSEGGSMGSRENLTPQLPPPAYDARFRQTWPTQRSTDRLSAALSDAHSAASSQTSLRPPDYTLEVMAGCDVDDVRKQPHNYEFFLMPPAPPSRAGGSRVSSSRSEGRSSGVRRGPLALAAAGADQPEVVLAGPHAADAMANPENYDFFLLPETE